MAQNTMAPKVFQEMLENKYAKQAKRFQTYYDSDEMKGDSPSDVAYKTHMALYDALSEPLKKMQVEYLTKVAKTCYKDKHMSEDSPNAEQVSVCRDRVHERIFGKFFQQTSNLRDSTAFKYSDCLVEASNDPIKAVKCVRNYLKQMDSDNKELCSFF